ncbi:PAS domain S-box protein, partial [bacterium]|nr:PAS domain S-box protein [bacterium]
NEKEICDYFIKKALLELELEDVVLYLIDENDPEKLNPVAAYHYIEKEAKIHKFIKPLHFSEGIVGRCARLRTTQLVNNTLHDPDYINDGINGKSELSVPIIVKGQVVGVLDSESMKTNSYSSFHKDIFETATSMLGVKLDQIRSLNRVKQTESYLFEILESPKSLIVFSVDVDYCYKAFNTNHKEIMKNIWGADIEIGANMLDFITKPEDKNKARLNFDKAMTGDEFTILEEYGDEERQRSYWENFYSPQYNDHKEVVGVTVFVRDVSKEMQYQQELADSQLLISSINANIRDGLFRKSLNNGFVYVNDAMTELFGMSREEFKSHSFRKLFAKAEVADHVMDQMLDFEPIKNKEALFMRRNGSQFWGLLNCISYRKNDEILIDASLVDISELKNTHSILEKKVEELKKLNEELDHLVYRTSHDLRAPVASLLGLLELLKLDQTPDPKEYMSLFNSQLGRLDHIIKDIINYRKIAKMGAKNEAIDFKTLIDQVISDNAYTEGSHRIEKVVRVQNPDNITAYLDKFSLNIILNNLISNAIKYADIDKKNPQVEVDVLIENDKVQLIVADNGIGIEKEYHDKIFDMFFRATSKKHGTGLGLFILREALLKMGGQLDFQSEPGKGSTFVLTFQNSEVE